jgi:endonuclease/exonuclease/phosphatase family metal-dependent hydrolase
VPPFPKPTFPYDYIFNTQVQELRQHKITRAIPAKAPDRLLIATWNIANLGVQERRPKDRKLIAEILSWFDIVAIQETNANWTHLRDIQHGQLNDQFRLLLSDAGGNNERMAFLYDAAKVRPLELVGEVSFPPADYHNVKLPGIAQAFKGFDRNPYFATFEAGNFSFTLANVHLFFGGTAQADIDRRALETFAVARWADREASSNFTFTRDIIALGDFNMPKAVAGDPIFEALTARGLVLPGHSTQVGSSVASDAQYDQIAFFPGPTQNDFTGQKGVFDFDAVLFRDLWQQSQVNFKTYIKYYVSDHRPMWAEFRIT